MEIRDHTFKKLGQICCGDEGPSNYLSGSKLVDFFNELGYDDKYDENFGYTRYVYAKERIEDIVGKGQFNKFINYFLDEYRFIDTDVNPIEVLDHMNEYLNIDGYEISQIGKNKYAVYSLKDQDVVFDDEHFDIISTEFLQEQVEKCERKIFQEDYDGAITNARSMVEEILLEVEARITGKRDKYNGKIDQLYGRVKKLINFDTGKEGLNTPLLQVLTGLNSIVSGLGALRTKASDAHASEYRPDKHHAILAVNSAKTFTAFIISSYRYQIKKDNVEEIN